MKLIIELEENDYNLVYDLISGVEPKFCRDRVYKAIANGTPYNPSGDLISREALKEALYDFLSENSTTCDWEDIFNVIDNAQAVDLGQMSQEATENALKKAEVLYNRPKGEWISMNPDCRGYSDYFKCSICGAYIYPNIPEKELDYNGCPYCFADMQKGGAE